MNQKAETLNNKIYKIVMRLLPNHTTDNTQLDEVGFKLLNNYLGTFPVDQVPTNLKKGDSLIFNLDDSTEPGSHWMGGYCFKKNELLVYDSFGRATKTIAPSLLLKTQDTQDDAEQQIHETNCGARCMAFLCLAENFGKQTAKYL